MQRSISIVRIKRTFIASLYLSSLLFPLNSFADEGDVPKAATTDSGASSAGVTSAISSGIDDAVKGVGEFFGGMLSCEPTDAANQQAEAQAPGQQSIHDAINETYSGLADGTDDGGYGPLQACSKLVGTELLTCKITELAELKAAFEKYKSNWSTCHSAQQKAAAVCLECNNTELSNSISQINLMLTGFSSMGVNQQCSTSGKIMSIASIGLSAYTAACGVVKSGCGVYCGSASTGLKSMKAALAKMKLECTYSSQNPNGAASCAQIKGMLEKSRNSLAKNIDLELAEGTLGSIAGKGKRCSGEYGKLLMAAMAGILQMKNYKAQADACKAASAASASSSSSTVDCSLAANASLPTCICEKNPRNPGCNNSLTKASSASAVGFTGTAAANTATASGTSGTTAGTAYSAGVSKVSNASGSIGSIGAASSGSPSSGSGLGADGQTAAAAAAAGEAGYVPMEYATEMSSMGGGSGWGGGAPAGDSAELEKFLPGGVEDPNAMSGEAFPQDVTTESGKSNWDKVRSRYSETKRTLIGN